MPALRECQPIHDAHSLSLRRELVKELGYHDTTPLSCLPISTYMITGTFMVDDSWEDSTQLLLMFEPTPGVSGAIRGQQPVTF
jgi:hypothetical protein